MPERKILITGASGQDGSIAVEKALERGWEVHATFRSAEQLPHTPKGAIGHVADLTTPGEVRRLIRSLRPTRILHLASVSSVAKSWDDPEATFTSATLSTVEMLQAAWELQRSGTETHFVHASSAEIFGEAREELQDELTPIAPTSPYGVAKAASHRMVSIMRDRGLNASNAILFNHESWRRPVEFVTRKITRTAAKIRLGQATTLELGNLQAVRDWGWAPDYVDAMMMMLEAEVPSDYVIATGQTHSVGDFAKAAFESVGLPEWTKFVVQDERLMRPTDSRVLCGDASSIRNDLNWSPTVTFQEVVREMVEYDLAALRAERELRGGR